MSRANHKQWYGFSAILGGLLLLVTYLLGWRSPANSIATLVALAVPPLLLIGLVGLTDYQAESWLKKAGQFTAAVGVGALLIGMILMALQQASGFVIWISGVLLLPLGLLLLGLNIWFHKPLPRWNNLPFLVGLLSGPVALVVELSGVGGNLREPGWTLWILAMGCGWMLLGYLISTSQHPPSVILQQTEGVTPLKPV